MRRLFLWLSLWMPLTLMAGTIQSPNGQVALRFHVDGDGRPVYEMTYKGLQV